MEPSSPAWLRRRGQAAPALQADGPGQKVTVLLPPAEDCQRREQLRALCRSFSEAEPAQTAQVECLSGEPEALTHVFAVKHLCMP